MASRPPTYERHVDQDGVVRLQEKSSRRGGWLVALALGFTLVCGALSLWLVWGPESPRPVPAAPARAAVKVAPAPVRPPAPGPAPAPGQLSVEADPPPPRTAVDEGPAEGLNLYRPGARPLKQGLIVPEDFELPPGYVRHYQATDDGERVKPILMFHPDYQPLDANGQPLELPASRVVPPELAPPGFPLDVLELPEGPEGVEPIP